MSPTIRNVMVDLLISNAESGGNPEVPEENRYILEGHIKDCLKDYEDRQVNRNFLNKMKYQDTAIVLHPLTVSKIKREGLKTLDNHELAFLALSSDALDDLATSLTRKELVAA